MNELSDDKLLEMYRQLHYLPPRAPCYICPEKIHEDRIQACDRAGCGLVHLYLAAKHYDKEFRTSFQMVKQDE